MPKTHAILHMLSFMVLFGSPDNARPGDEEKDHQPYVKKAVRRTRQWETTLEDEVFGVADRIDAMLQIRSERAALCGRFRCTWSPFETVYAFLNRFFGFKTVQSVSKIVKRFLFNDAAGCGAAWPAALRERWGGSVRNGRNGRMRWRTTRGTAACHAQSAQRCISTTRGG